MAGRARQPSWGRAFIALSSRTRTAMASAAMIHFMWQDDIIRVPRFTDASLERVYTSDGPPWGPGI